VCECMCQCVVCLGVLCECDYDCVNVYMCVSISVYACEFVLSFLNYV
jgi:hypothetical protein